MSVPLQKLTQINIKEYFTRSTDQFNKCLNNSFDLEQVAFYNKCEHELL